MLARVLEPEVMDSAEEARDYDAMDHSAVNQVFAVDFLARRVSSGRVIDVGTGTAQIPIEVCRRHPDVTVVAVDAAEHMLRQGRYNVERAGFGSRIELRLCDAKRLPFADGAYSAVMSNSIVHHIPEPRRVLAEMVRVVSPGGIVFVRDLLRPATDAEVLALVELHARDCNAFQRGMFDASLRAALSLEEIRAIVASLGFDRDGVKQTTDRHWTWSAEKLSRPL